MATICRRSVTGSGSIRQLPPNPNPDEPNLTVCPCFSGSNRPSLPYYDSRMRKLYTTLWLILMIAGLALLGQDKKPPEKIVFQAKPGNVTFVHATHIRAAKGDCKVCHDSLFQQNILGHNSAYFRLPYSVTLAPPPSMYTYLVTSIEDGHKSE